MSFLVYVNMQKRSDGKVYPDMHKTDERVYFTPEDAQRAIDADPRLAPHRHVVGILCQVAAPEELLDPDADDDGRCPTCGEDGGTSCGMPNCGLLA